MIVFLLYFLFTPFLLIGLFKVRFKTLFTAKIKLNLISFQASPNWFIPYLIYDIVMINLSGCFFIVALIVWNMRMFWLCFIFFALKLNSAVGIFSVYKDEGGKVSDVSELSFLSGISPATTTETLCEAVNV